MEFFKCSGCSRVFPNVTTAINHYVTTHRSPEVTSPSSPEGTCGEYKEQDQYCTSIVLRQLRIVVTRMEDDKGAESPRAILDKGKKVKEIKLDELKASEIERVMATLFSNKSLDKSCTCDKGGVFGKGNACDEVSEKDGLESDDDVDLIIRSPSSDEESDCSDSDYVPSDAEEEDDNFHEDEDDKTGIPLVVNEEEEEVEDDGDNECRHEVATIACSSIDADKNYNEPNFQCHFCEQVFNGPSRVPLVNHMRKEHYSTKDDGYVCRNCDRVFHTGSGFFDHLWKKPRLPCPTLSSDMSTATPQDAKEKYASGKFKCMMCLFGFDSQNHYILHMRDKHRDREKCVYSCPKCDQSFQRLKDFGVHIRKEFGRVRVRKTQPKTTTKKKKKSGKSSRRFSNSKKEKVKSRHHTSTKRKPQCDICGKFYVDRHGLQRHIMLHKKWDGKKNVDFPFSCPLCSSRLLNEETYKAHLKLHLPGNPYKCEMEGCNCVFRNRHHLGRHMSTHTDTRTKYECSHCSSLVSRLDIMKKHTDFLHPGKPLKYRVCVVDSRKRKAIPKEDDVGLPSVIKKEDEYRVEVGSIDLDDTSALIEEEPKDIDVAKDRQNAVQFTPVIKDLAQVDPALEEAIEKYPDLVKNMHRIIAQRKKALFKCSECEWVGIYRSSLMRHVQMEHGGGNSRDKRATKVNRKNSLPPGPSRVCRHCGFTANSAEALAEHIDKEHIGNKKFPCPFCHQRFASEKRKLKHVKDIHKSKRKFKCDVPSCGKAYHTNAALQNHIKFSHSGSPVECETCGQFYPSVARLNVHQSLIHERNFDLDQYRCKCGDVFATAGTLRTHIQLIHGRGVKSNTASQVKHSHPPDTSLIS